MEETPLVYFEEQFTDQERARVTSTLRQAERALDLPEVPASAGALWTVGLDRNGLVTISRLGVRYVFVAGSVEAAARKVERWTEEQGGGHTNL